ncbi:receptor-type tyrosine-protein phosphatase O-like isoform X1 [Paramormyrops kingsleyae]|uniref:receptor-type tyrosine-protein phosphatase O-like isoform X1 n=2 Tax=Paramormyrops kingsleyae TaxID=1676925 RepID=UPI003B9743A1
MFSHTVFLLCIQSAASLLVIVRDEGSILISLEASDVREDTTAYAVIVSGEPKTHFLQFDNPSGAAPHPLVFNASYHGLCYTVSLVVSNGTAWSKPGTPVSILTRPLPVDSVLIHDYKPSPETGIVFEMKYAENNIFTRVNISYLERQEHRWILYKDFTKGKTVFKHWLPGTCYTNITFQLVSEATINKSAVVRHSGVIHQPTQHRTVPNPPLNVSLKITQLGDRPQLTGIHDWLLRRSRRNVPLMGKQEQAGTLEEEVESTEYPDPRGPVDLVRSLNGSMDGFSVNGTEDDNSTQPYWPDSTTSTAPAEQEGQDSVNAPFSEYEDSPELGSAGGPALFPTSTSLPPRGPPMLLELRWLPPRPPTAFDGFKIYIYKDGNSTEMTTMDENTHEFFTELTEPGTYRVLVTTLSSSGDCDPRESTRDTSITFYLSHSGEWFEQPTERPQAVSVRLLNPTTAAVSWSPSTSHHNGSLVAVLSLTCLKPTISQRTETTYCAEENSTSDIITNLTPGAQYRVVVYHTNGPLASPPSDPIIIGIEPTGVRDLVVYPLSPSAIILTWQRLYNVAFRKYILETFFFNPVTLTSGWTTYYEVAATASLTASVRVTDLLPAWYYNFRVTMVTWGEPALRCCDASTVSFITAPEAPHISSVEYSNGLLYVRWTYGDIFTDLSHSRVLHWQVVAEGKKSLKKRISADVTRMSMKAALAIPPGDIYNLTVSACTERSRNTSRPHIIKLGPAPPRSVHAVNSTHTSVTLIWVEEGVVDYYQVHCRPAAPGKDLKAREPQMVHSHIATMSGLQPATAYNCSVTSYSYSTPSEPTYIGVSTTVREMNPSVAAISALAVLSVLLLSLLGLIFLVLRKKHLQMARECGAGTFVNFASFERDGKLPYNWRRSLFAFLTLLPSCLWTDYLLAFYINPWGKTALKKRKLTSPVQLDDFEDYLKDMSKDSAYKFSLQFEELKTVGLDLSHDAADLPVNRAKNRYTNILPYDFSRVKLISMHNDEGADYVNANYIPGYKLAREYIATQGPLPETRNDFWTMVLQQKSRVVVMLTQCSERRRVKCDHYWPFTDEPVAYGEITVEMLSEKEAPEWTMRNFRLSYADETQDVLHLNYTSWPDHGVPTVNAIESILQFVYIVRQQAAKSRGPIVVHCSAGVGRTGTFIALDRLMQHIREHDYADILGVVAEMRAHRLCMVQTEEQYVFIHQCVQLMCKKKKQQSSVSSDVIYENVSKS